MQTIQGPAIFLAQFAGDEPPFNTLAEIAKLGRGPGYQGVQIPSWDARLFDLAAPHIAATIATRYSGILAANGLQLTELSTHLQGQLVAVHPAYDQAFDGFAPPAVRGNPRARGRHGPSSSYVGRESSATSGSQVARHVFGRTGLAVFVSVAATPRRSGRDRF